MSCALCKSTVLSAAFLAEVVVAANADPASTNAAGTVANGVSGSQSQGRRLAAFPPSTATPVPTKKNSLALSKPLSSLVVSLPTISKEHTVPEVHDNLPGFMRLHSG